MKMSLQLIKLTIDFIYLTLKKWGFGWNPPTWKECQFTQTMNACISNTI